MIDISQTIKPKSDQLNADDLVAGPITIKITDVKLTGNTQQPVSIFFQNCNNKPYKPCLGMRRLLCRVWGKDGSTYTGKRLKLFRDDGVKYAGQNVGGIRISHMSSIGSKQTFLLTVSKTKRVAWSVEPICELNTASEKAVNAALKKVGSFTELDEIIAAQNAWSNMYEFNQEFLDACSKKAQELSAAQPQKEFSDEVTVSLDDITESSDNHATSNEG